MAGDWIKFEDHKMIKNCTYVIPHTCYVQHQNDDPEGETVIFGKEPDRNGFCTYCVSGFRCIGLVERVRDHWVVDTWLECCKGDTRKQVKLLGHKYLKQLLRGAKLWGKGAV